MEDLARAMNVCARYSPRLAALAGAVLLPLPLAAQSDDSERIGGRIDSVAQAAVAAGTLAGLALAAVRGGDTLALAGVGKANLEWDVPVTPETVFRIGSLTKQFTAAAILQLAERGQVDLDAQIERYVPEFDERGRQVTLRHLLSHTSGIPSYTSLGARWRARVRDDRTQAEMLDLFQREPFEFEPGERFQYSNSGYFLLGMVIERVSGITYGGYLEANIFEPLGMRDTRYCDARRTIPRRAEGYVRVSDGFVNDEPISMTQPFAAGALCSTVRDLLVWGSGLHGGRVVNPASYRLMVDSFVLNDGSLTDYGFGFSIAELDAYRVISHSGGIDGFSAHLSYFPDADLAIVALSNTEGARLWTVVRDIARIALGTLPAEPADRPLPPEQGKRYLGSYDAGNANVRVFLENGSLWAQITGQAPFRLLYQGGHRFVAEFDHSIELRFTVRGRYAVEFSLVQGNRERRALRVPF